MARTQLDQGPAVAQALAVAPAVINNVSLTVLDGRGPMLLQAVLNIQNPAANAPTCQARLLKNGVAMAGGTQNVIMVASTQHQVVLHAIDAAPAAGDVYTVDCNTTSVVAGHQIPVNGLTLTVQALAQDAAKVSNVGSPAA